MTGEYIRNCILLILEFMSLYFLTKGILKETGRQYLHFLVAGLLLMLFDGYLETYLNNPTLTLIVENLLYVLLFYFTIQVRILHAICIYLFEYIFIALCSVMLFPIFGLNGSTIFQGIVPYIGSILILILCYLAYRFLPLWRIYGLLQHHNNTVLLILINTFLLALGFILYARFDSDDFFSHYLLIFVFTFALIFINGEVFINHQKRIREKQQLEVYHSYLPIVENLIEQVRIKQHDYHNHLQNIRGLCYTCQDFESLKQALLSTSDYYIADSLDSSILKINLHLVAGFLVSKMNQAKEQNKHLHINVVSYTPDTTCNEYELIECLGILIDNALESSSEGDVIYASLSSENGQFVFTIKNPGPVITPELTRKMFRYGHTSKTSATKEHGIGLHKLQTIVKKNNGSIQLENNAIDGRTYIVFHLKI